MTIKQKTSWLTVLPSLVIPISVGLTMYLGLAYMIEQSILTNELLVRYTTGHPISRFTTGMFFIGVASLLMIAKNVFEQFSTESKIQLIDSDETTATQPTDKQPAATPKPSNSVAGRATGYQNNLNEHAAWSKEHYLWQRLSAMMAYLQRSDSTANAETELKYLSELDYERQQQRFALVRILIWATPMLGFLGTVLGISEALGGISVGPENNFETMMNGLRGSLYVAFDTTALALTLSMFLMFGQFLIDRFELQLLSIVDTRVHAEINRNFDLTSTGDVTMRTFSEQFLETSKEAAINQTKLWKRSIDSAQKAWSSTLTDTNANVQRNLTEALSQNTRKLATQLTTAIERADNAMSHRWQQWQVTLSDNCRLLSAHQKQLGEQTSQFSKIVSEKSETHEFKNAIQQNNQAIEATKQLRETLGTLSASIQTMQKTSIAQTKIADKLASVAKEPTIIQQPKTQTLATKQLTETLTALSDSIQTMQKTSVAQTKIADKLASVAKKPTIIQQPETQTLATQQLTKTLSTLADSIQTMQKTSVAQTEITSKLTEAVAKQPIVQRLIHPQPQAIAGKLRIDTPQKTDSHQLAHEIDIVKAVVQMLPPAKPSNTPSVTFSLQAASINKSVTKARIAQQTQPPIAAKPETDVVFQSGSRFQHPAVESIRETNNRVADFLSKQSRPARGRSAV